MSTDIRRWLGRSAVTLVLAGGLLGAVAPAGSASTAGDYGPFTCKQGYVWREAYTGDVVCVTPDIRDQSARENRLGPSRKQPGGGAYGPDTCRAGYVWREAAPWDVVCVPPASRDQARADNAAAVSRLASTG
ncbi:hypothetical protein [Streptomyces sp. NPDC048340]|uniref:hypothetical protein n=1 Tax=Streptomyces sp. NPDC048340 TaxID=3365537 RepID=UPI00371C8763